MNTLFEKIKNKALNPKTQIDMGEFSKNTIPSKVSLEQLENVEQKLGFQLPEILKQCYTEIGNGHFGPGYGLLPLFPQKKNYNGTDEENILAFNEEFTKCEFDFWTPSCIPLVHWGCGIYSFMDLAQPEKNIVIFDGNNFEEDIPGSGIFETKRNLQSFLEAWTQDIIIWDEMFNDFEDDA